MALFFHLILYIEEKTMKTEHILVIRFSAMGGCSHDRTCNSIFGQTIPES